MKSKRAILVPEVMKIIIAVVCITLLIVLSVQLYSLFKAKTRIDQANGNLEEIMARMSELKDGEKFSFNLLSPSGYILTGWPIASYLPEACSKNNWQNCLCFCPYTRDQRNGLWDAAQHASLSLNALATIKATWDAMSASNDIAGAIYEVCKSDAICKKVDKPVSVSGSALNSKEEWISWDILNKPLSGYVEKFQILMERQNSINVNDLMKAKQPIIVSYSNGGYSIYVS